MASEGTSRSLQDTPSWALATVCFVFIFLSIFIEHLIHLLSQVRIYNYPHSSFEEIVIWFLRLISLSDAHLFFLVMCFVQFLKRHKKTALLEAVEKLKSGT